MLEGVPRDHHTTFIDGHGEVLQRQVERCIAIHRHERPAVRAYPRIGQQIADQGLHAPGAFHRVPDQFVGPGVEPVVIVLFQNFDAARHRPQRLLQVVGSDVSELLEFLYRRLQLRRAGKHPFLQRDVIA